MSIARRITRYPRPYDAALGADVLTQLPGFAPDIGALLAGTAGCSPYLAGLMRQEKDWLPAALDDP